MPMRIVFFNHPVLFCVVLYAVAMEGVNFATHQIVGSFGVVGGLATIAAMYGAARYFERRR
jgi:hypothetical protein